MRVCLIVDNPLRDLDGLALLAWHIARAGGEAYLVPMYTQGFDVPAIAPDAVLANYVRRNNADVLKLYRSMGSAVVVMDTEGAVGKSAEDNAKLVAAMHCADFIDAYCFWGESQRDAFRRVRAMPESLMRPTGCPRYDFCAPQWRAALERPAITPGYVLVNTNFPVVNPRYSADTAAELAIWDRTGVDPAWARRYAADAARAHRTVIETVARLASRFQGQHFVVRPHPFERASAYDELVTLENCEVRQEGTSLAWLNAARLLLHQNCSTAVEAAMLDVEPISLEWFNTEALHVPAPCAVSHPAPSYTELERMVARHLAGPALAASEAQRAARSAIVREQYLENDGRSAERVAQVLAEVLDARERPRNTRARRSLRGRAVHAARLGLGYRAFERARHRLSEPAVEARRAAKYFTHEQVADIMRRIDTAAGTQAVTQTRPVGRSELVKAWLSSGRVVRVARSD
jgi:surface carbohydrate biosynthesis protein